MAPNNIIKRFNSIKDFENETKNLNEKWYEIQCFTENNWRVVAVYVSYFYNSDEETNEETTTNDWGAS